MPFQPELFPLPLGFHPSPSLQEPRLWVRELRIYRVFAPGKSNLLRSIPLQRGLNILWAKPRASTQNERRGRAPSVSGHGTGKTTFCRFLRYILGEGTFGSDEQRARLRDAFPEGWVVGEVHLDGTPWIVCRPIKIGPPSHVYRNRTLDTLFLSEEGRTTIDVYRDELNRLFAGPLPVATFASAPVPIEWPHLLQWLTRDQECRFSGLAELRHPSSESHAPEMMAEDRHFLFRAVLGLIDTAEQSELENNKKFLRLRQDAERDAPLLRFRGDSVCKRLRDQFPDFRTDLAGADFLNAIAGEWAGRAKATETLMNTLGPAPGLKAALDNTVITRSAVSVIERQLHNLKIRTGHLDQQIRQLRDEPADTELDAWLKEYDPDETGRMCGQTLAAAIEHECPLAAGRKLPIEHQPADFDTQSIVDKLEAEKKQVDGQRADIESKLQLQKRKHDAASAALEGETAKHESARAGLARQLADEQTVAAEARRAHADKVESDRLEASIAALEQKIRKSQESQSVIREKKSAALSSFSETFGRVARAILEDGDVKGEIRFNGRKIRPTLTNEIDLTSAALDTLKIICFDLAALITGVEGRGCHPRFLLHDGPREADMDASLYRNIFTTIHALEQSFGKHPPAFQYIITTTESPPDELQKTPWLIEPPLDASEPGGKLLGENF